MHPSKVNRQHLIVLTDLPNIGPSTAADLRLLGINTPQQLLGRDAFNMYKLLCDITQTRQDPCVLDVFISITDFISGNPPQAWWHYTAKRKQLWPSL
jgi:hypothetical protein